MVGVLAWARPRGGALAGAAVLVVTLAAFAATWAPQPDTQLATALPSPSDSDRYATSDTCQGCHPAAYASWYGSYHRTMTQEATPEAVVAPFDGQELEARGRRVRLERIGDGYYARLMVGPNPPRDRIVLTTGSHHFQNYWMIQEEGWLMQVPWVWLIEEQRWVPTPDSFLQPAPTEAMPPAMWNNNCIYCHTVGGVGLGRNPKKSADSKVAELGVGCEACHRGAAEHVETLTNPAARYRRHLFGDEGVEDVVIRPDTMDHRAASAVCGRCHSVSRPHDPTLRHDEEEDLEPGEPLTKNRFVFRIRQNPFHRGDPIIPPAPGADATVTVHTAGGAITGRIRGIEARNMYIDGVGLAGGPAAVTVERPPPPEGGAPASPAKLTMDAVLTPYEGGVRARFPAPPEAAIGLIADVMGYGELAEPTQFDLGAFWGDGTVRTVGREYNGLLESGCFTRGEMSCGSCHSMHAYVDAKDQLLPDMDGDEACLGCHADFRDRIEAHTHHPPDSSGSHCYNCHMPFTTYGLLGAARSHRVDSPSAAVSAATGRPNACNLCHLDRTLAWSAERLSTWYDAAPATLDDEEQRIAAGALWVTRGDAAQRAITAWNMGWGPAVAASGGVEGSAWTEPLLADLLEDEYAAVRAIAWKALRDRPVAEGIEYDFVGEPAERSRLAAEIRERWSDRSSAAGAPGSADHLLSGPGRRDGGALERLRGARDHRPVHIAE